MTERQPQVLDLEQIIRTRAGKKARYIPQFLINWFKKAGIRSKSMCLSIDFSESEQEVFNI